MEQGDYKDNFPRSRSKWQLKVEQQDNELIAWIDEFLESDEYTSVLQKNVQSSANLDSAVSRKPFGFGRFEKNERESEKNHSELAEDSRKYDSVALLDDKVQGSLLKLKIKNTVANQRMGIDIIRQKILEAKQQHEEYNLSIAEKEYDNKLIALQKLRKDYQLSLDSSEVTPDVVRKLAKSRKTSHKNSIEKRKIQVVSNILRDMRRDQIEKRLKTKQPKIKTKRKSITSIATTEELPTYTKSEFTEIDTSLKLNVSEEETSVVSTPKKKKTDGKTKFIKNLLSSPDKKTPNADHSPKNKKVTKPRKEQKSTEKSSKKSQKLVKPHEENVIPSFIPNPNPRRKIVPEYVLTEILENITKLYNYLKDKESYEFEDGLTPDILLPFDDGFFSKPNKIIFKDYEPGKRYKKIISIVNGNQVIKKISLDRVIWNTDVEEDLLLDVEAFGIRRVLPGMSFSISLRFAPIVLNKTIDGKIVFITNKLRNTRSEQFVLKIVCVPRCAAVLISPTIVSFEEIPIWRARALMKQNKNYRTVTISNSGLKECKVVVTKIFNNQTMEQEWKKIISIIRIDDISDSEKKQLSSSNLEDPSTADPFPRNLVQQCVENVFNVFKFERNVFNVLPKSTTTIKCWLKDLSEPGYQVESYNFSIYERFLDGQLYCIGAQDVIVNSETTSHFLTSSVEILDFEVCVYGSAYQLDFDLTNPCKLAHHIRICFPSRMKDYLQANPGVTTILPNQTIKICVRFLPKACILKDNKFYDSEVCLLDFPVHVTVQTKTYEDTPPLRIDVFAAVTEAQGVVLRLLDELEAIDEKGNYSYDLGQCTTMETIYLDICVHNISLVPQQFAFLSLPTFVSLTPNCGFGILKPMEKATVRALISPAKQHITNQTGLVNFRLVVSTVKHCGALKTRSNEKNLVKKLKDMEDFVCKSQGSTSSKLKEDMHALSEAFKRKSLSIPSKSSSQSLERFIHAVDNEELINLVKYDIEEEKEVSSKMDEVSTLSRLSIMYTNMLHFRLNVVDVVVELSHQILCFPNTPCGSYSTMNIDLILHQVKWVKYHATFEIFSDSDQFEVEPSFGKLTGKKRAIWVVVRPKIPQRVVEEKTLALKQKAKEEVGDVLDDLVGEVREKKAEKAGVKTKSKQGSTKNTSKNKPNKDAKSKVDPAIITQEDLYQAEMNVWRTIEPYSIEALFTCRVNFRSARPQEEIRFKALCQVVSPNFIHDQAYQVIDFGPVAIGAHSTKTLNFKNIQRRNIVIDVSLLNPIGPFSSTAVLKPLIPPEYIYSFPIRFTPTEEQSEVEFLDAISDNTSYPFMLRGVGIKPKLVFTPEFTVSRLTATKSDFQDVSFDIRNESVVKVQVYLQKVCELEGTITEKQPGVSQTPKKSPKTTKPQKHTKFSPDLTDDEIDALSNTFARRQGSPLFHVVDTNEVDNSYILEPNSKRRITIRFSSKPNTTTKKNLTYMAKYNIFVGLNYIKDIIVISFVT